MKLKGGKRTAEEIKLFLQASYEKNPPKQIGDWILDDQISKSTGLVYHNPISNETVVAHRGTKGAKDWGNNLAYTVGLYNTTNRYKEGKRVQERAEKKYGKKNISTLGHSQGAVLSRKLGSDTKEIINVNPAYMGEKPKKNEYNIRSSRDVASKLYEPVSVTRRILFPKYSKKHDITIDAESFNPLTEHRTDILDRLDPNKEIGAGRKNKISTITISMNQKVKDLVEYGIPKKAVTLLKKTGHLEQVWDAVDNGENLRPLLEQVLDSLDEYRQPRSSEMKLNTNFGATLGDDMDPSQEPQVSEPFDIRDSAYGQTDIVEQVRFDDETGGRVRRRKKK